MDTTGFGLPLRIDVASGKRLEPSGLDPYALPWVQGASSTLHRRTRDRYPNARADLREKLAVLRSKRTTDTDADDPLVTPVWGPRLRPWQFRALDGVPTAQ